MGDVHVWPMSVQGGGSSEGGEVAVASTTVGTTVEVESVDVAAHAASKTTKTKTNKLKKTLTSLSSLAKKRPRSFS
jgi:hypothetical protein